jgi:hypothetical protein
MKHLLLILAASTSLSSAAVIYSGLQNIPISSTFTSVYVDVDAVTFSGTFASGSDIDAFFGGEAFGNFANFQPVRQTVAVDSAIVRLLPGATVDGSNTYATGPAGSSDHIGPAIDQFQDGETGHLGFRLFTNGGAGPYYGWMRVNFSNTGANGSIIDWAYENSGAAITVGTIPEPSAAVLLGLASLGLAFNRRRPR